ncbi:MAG TPA: hypothetical protein VH083_16250 [Myxococcales bacterium]|nr:hypothetical protein [Myxococcales bacterium]
MTLALALLLAAQARVVVTSGVNGDLARPACAVGGFSQTAFGSGLAPAVAQAVREGALAVDTGGLLTFSGVARFAAQSAPKELASVAAGLGYRAVFIGIADLAAPREPALNVWRELKALQIPAVATNLRCDGAHREICAGLSSGEALLVQSGSTKIALIAVLPANALNRVATEESQGLSLEDPAAAIARATRSARAAGADLVIASIDESPASAAAGKVLELAAKLPADGRPDLLLAARAGAQLLFARPPGVKPALAAAPMGGAIDVRFRAAEADILVRPLAEAAAVAEPIQHFSAAVGPAFCAAWGRPLRGGHLARPLDGDGLLSLAANSARAAAHAEVAIINRAAVDSAFHPARASELSASDLFEGMPFDEPLEVAEVSGDWLAARAKTTKDLLVLGVSADGMQINGRPIEPNGTYRVATLRFLAQGGDGALPRGPAWVPVAKGSLRTSLIEALERPEERDPREALPDPARAVEWTLRPDLDARFSSTSISNPGAYTAAALARSNVFTAGFETNLRLTADSPRWLWENAGLWRYTSTHTAAPASVTHDDLESIRSTLTERTLFGPTGPATPQPYIEGYVETEGASIDDAGTRRWLGRGSAGLRLQPHPKLSLKLAAALERQVGDGAPRTLLGANAQLALTPWELFRAGSRRIQADALVDAFIGGSTALTTVRAHAGLTLDLIGPLSLVLAADLYAERDGAGPFGAALDTSAGLRVRTVERTSSF